MADDPGEGEGEDERASELSTVAAIYPELVLGPPHSASIEIQVEPIEPLSVVFPSLDDGAPPLDRSNALPPVNGSGVDVKEETIRYLEHLPPLKLQISLPDGYPTEKPPLVDVAASWLPPAALGKLKNTSQHVWEEVGRDQAVFSYIDHVRDAAESAFGLMSDEGPLHLPPAIEVSLLDFDLKAKRAKFEKETYECGICLEPKKGSACHRLLLCSHVFCVECLQDFYNSCISEGDIGNVKCTAPNCSVETKGAGAGGIPESAKDRSLEPSELLQIPLTQEIVQRYIKLKRKKRLESDRSTVYCPRQWCQGPARWKKAEISTTTNGEKEVSGNVATAAEPTSYDKNANPDTLPPPSERLAICEDCNFAFCKVCKASWHGEYYTCFPRSQFELTAEERASEDYMKLHTQPCPTCDTRAQKTHGCNHMICFKCDTHYCYLCGAYLDRANPYTHYNTIKSSCYMRLWELEGGDDGEIGLGFGGGHGDFVGGDDDDEDDVDEAPIEVFNLAIDEVPAPPPQVEAPPQPAPQRGRANARGGGGAGNHAPRANQGLQRFIQMAVNDEEDGWDSDDLSDVSDFDED